MEICSLNQCTGCFACMNVCPHNAISVSEDETGKTIPEINNDICVKCDLCKKICPVNNPVEVNEPSNAYASWSKSINDVHLSSSGAVAYILSKFVLNNNGIVFGCSSENGYVKHISINNIKDLDKLRGSKYVQSYVGYTYKEVKEHLNKGKLVLFIGVPCQISGLKNFLKIDYDNLILIDLICHGTPPFKYLKQYIDKELKSKKWDSVSFRGKFDWKLCVYRKNKLLYNKSARSDMYYTSFLDALTYRDNCYECKYACRQRCSDITIGDYWGLERSTLKEEYDGNVSVILTNTKKGIDFLKNINDENFYFEKRPLDEPFNESQLNLLQPSVPHKDRKEFLDYYIKTNDFVGSIIKTSVYDKCDAYSKIEKKQNRFYVRYSILFKMVVKRILKKVKFW